MKEVSFYVAVIVFTLALCVLAWRFEKWVNWKLYYGPKSDSRIEALEAQVSAIEQRLTSGESK